jgi:hypothetical protein
MKKFLAVLLLALGMIGCQVEASELPKSWYYQVDRNVKVIISQDVCTVMEGQGEKLFSAYALNTDTGDRVDGCFSFRRVKDSDKIMVHIELQGKDATPEGQPYIKHFTYDYPIEKFQLSETL